jgi:hypothetical protein
LVVLSPVLAGRQRVAKPLMVDSTGTARRTLVPAQSNFAPGTYNGMNKVLIEANDAVQE